MPNHEGFLYAVVKQLNVILQATKSVNQIFERKHEIIQFFKKILLNQKMRSRNTKLVGNGDL